jgi:hypothetical protein
MDSELLTFLNHLRGPGTFVLAPPAPPAVNLATAGGVPVTPLLGPVPVSKRRIGAEATAGVARTGGMSNLGSGLPSSGPRFTAALPASSSGSAGTAEASAASGLSINVQGASSGPSVWALPYSALPMPDAADCPSIAAAGVSLRELRARVALLRHFNALVARGIAGAGLPSVLSGIPPLVDDPRFSHGDSDSTPLVAPVVQSREVASAALLVAVAGRALPPLTTSDSKVADAEVEWEDKESAPTMRSTALAGAVDTAGRAPVRQVVRFTDLLRVGTGLLFTEVKQSLRLRSIASSFPREHVQPESKK